MEDPVRSYIVGMLLGAFTLRSFLDMDAGSLDSAFRSMAVFTCAVLLDIVGMFMCGKSKEK